MRLLFGDCVMDVERRELRRAGDVVRVEPQVFDLILHLVENRDHVVSKEALLAAVWRKRVISDSALSTRINAARQAIGDSGERQQFIQTIPRRGFRFIGDVSGADPPSANGAAPAAAEDTPRGPSIAVLAFANLSDDREQDYFADGMAEDLITGLSHIRWLMVIARNSSFSYKGRTVDTRQIGRELNVRYLLEGSVRRDGNLVRINAQLVEAESGAQLWAGKFDGTLENIFDLQDRIVASVIGAIEPSLRGAEIERARRKRPDDLNAYDLYLRALSHVYAFTPEGRTAALELLGKALEINPNYVEAHGVAAACYTQRVWTQPEFATDLASALAHTRAIMSIKTDDASTLAFAAITYATATRDYETAIQMIEHALAHNPSSAAAQSVGAVVNAWAGRHETAVTLAERSLRFSPFEPTRHLALAALSRSRLFQGDPEAALAAARRAVQATPGHLPSHGYVVICLTRLGRLQDRDTTVERLLASFPGVRLSHFLAHSTFAPFESELAAAGLPL
jgi:TolB-like protein/Tfp pilus assembly protein PilF